MRKAEKILIVLFIIAQIMRLFYISGGEILSVLSSGALSLMYLFFGFALLNGVKFRDIFKKDAYKGLTGVEIKSSVFGSLALFAAVLGILYKLHFYDGAGLLLDAGFVFLVVLLVTNLIYHFNKKRGHFKNSLERLVPCCFVALILVATPTPTLIDVYYRKFPERAEELKKEFEEKDKTRIDDLHKNPSHLERKEN